MHSRRACLSGALLLSAGFVGAQDRAPFVPGCPTLPFTAQHQPIDDDCGIDGKSTAAAKKLESQGKNNLCASAPAVFTTFFTFEKLKRANEAPGFTLGVDRSGARNLDRKSTRVNS